MRAYELLKDRPYVDKVTSDGDLGRATSMAALGLRSRVLLYIASPLYNGNTDMASFRDVDGTPLISQTYDPEKWNEAAKAARLCLDEAAASGYVRLYERDSDPVTNYQNIFNQNWNEEILWAKNIGTYDHWENCCNPISFGCFSIINPTQEMVDAYEMADGSTPITGYTDNGLTPIINPESGYVEEGFTDTEYETAGRRVSATCMSIGSRVFMLRSILQEPSGLHPVQATGPNPIRSSSGIRAWMARITPDPIIARPDI